MKRLRYYLSLVRHYAFSRDWCLAFINRLFASYGGIWLITEALSFFNERAETLLSTKGIWFLAIGFLFALVFSCPKTVFAYQLGNRDTTIEVRIADAFKVAGALVVPINTSFDTDLDGRIPQADSIQGEFTRRYYDSDVSHLDLDIDKQLDKEGYSYEELTQEKHGKKRKYAIGTVIQLTKRNRLFYLVANTHINNAGVANTTIENLQESLVKLWYYISEAGSKGDVIIPLLGTGRARLGEKREEIFLEIIRSFIASCSSGAYCDKLVVAIYPPDVTKHKINLNNLRNFLEYACKYARFEA